MRYFIAIILCVALSSVCCASPGMCPYPQVQVAQATAPSAVTGLSASNSPAQITDTWTASSGATSYNVYYRQSAAPTTTTYDGKITGVSGSPYSLNVLTSGTAYYTGVTAVNGVGESAIVTTGPTTAGSPAQLTWPSALAANSITINGDSGYGGPGSTHNGVYTFSLAGHSSFTAVINAGGGDNSINGTGGNGGQITATFTSLTGTYEVFAGLADVASAISNDSNVNIATNGPMAATGGSSTAGAGGGGGADTGAGAGYCSNSDYGDQASCEDDGDTWIVVSPVKGASGLSVTVSGGTVAANGANGQDLGYGGGTGGSGVYKNVSNVTPITGGGAPAHTGGSISITIP